ncbi:MAG: hypothetical protein AB1894_24505 [Chloroflexota bacterium]
MTHLRYIRIGLIIALLLAGCSPEAAPTATPTTKIESSPVPPSLTPGSVLPTETATPTETAQPPSPTAKPTSTPLPALPPLPPEAQRIEFQADDGVKLVGYYYPAAVNPAPVVVLMHWAGGDQTDWLYVGMAAWLQNRGAQIPAPPVQKYFDTPYPFPPMQEGLSFAVFTFDFRGYGESSGSSQRDKHILDARAAYRTAAALPGVDSSRVAGIGASIGADGAVDGCNEACIGALSLGPGNWLDLAYSEAVEAMEELNKPAWCLAAEDDETGAQTCRAAAGEHYFMQIYASGEHAMQLFRAENNLQPPIETFILDYLKLVFSLP